MSEPRIISPLLDGFALGNSMSYHSGVNCYPAMRADSDERYIVKTISIPASQTQLEALLLTGAYPDATAAREYFKELTQGIRSEVETLDKLAAQRGFLPFMGYQVVPLEEGVGFEFYLISPYRQSLERFLKRSPMTHLSAVNMGIDLCAALAVCREAGYLYVDLKPSNIFLSGGQEYHIGDLGFVSMDSLKYASLPDRCRSNWTAPEVADAYATLNTTMDTYALGLILYQVYNNGLLPFDSEQSRQALMQQLAAGEPMPAPVYADYEMAQIILKACAYDPADRWQDPAEMGHALIAYMQRNGANDVPIGPPIVTDPTLTIQVPSEELLSDEPESPEEAVQITENGASDSEAEQAAAEAEESDSSESDWIDRMDALLNENGEGSEVQSEDSVTLRQVLSNEDTMPEDADVDNISVDALSDEVAGMLSQADELIAHETPEPAVAPEPIDIPMPEPIIPEPTIAEPDQTDDVLGEDLYDLIAQREEKEPDSENTDYPEDPAPKPRKGKKVLGWIIAILILALLGTGVFFGYNEFYLQEITSVSATGDNDTLTVNVVADMDQSLLTVVCVDQYGAKQTSILTNGTATFTNLTPDNQYNITLEAAGFHKLTGNTTAQYYTLPQTNVISFSAITGPEDGSVILSFTTEGSEAINWTVEYAAEGETPVPVSFTGNLITIPGLTPGTAYTFTLTTNDEVQLIGQTQISFTACNVICAENLVVSGYQDHAIDVTWTAPEDANIDSWTVRCYNEDSYDQTMTVNETSATFTDLDTSTDYTVEVTAAGMTQSARTYITAHPINVTAVNTEITDTDSLSVTWEYEGDAPEGGWLLLYTVDQSSEQHVIQCEETLATIEPVVPGSHYDLTIQAANSSTVFGGTGTVEIPEAEAFDQLGLKAADVKAALCKVPDKDDWNYRDVAEEDKTSDFASDDSVGILLSTTEKYRTDSKDISIVYAFRDAEGTLVTVCSDSDVWSNMWSKGHCELEIPQIPANAGSYTLEVYIGGQLMTSLDMTIA